MPLCTVCSHPQRHAIDAALLAHAGGYRVVARRFNLHRASVHRHAHDHLAAQIRAAEELRMLASTESLITEMNELHEHVRRVLERGEAVGDDRLVLQGVAQGARNIDVLARLAPLSDLEQRLAALEQAQARDGREQ